MTPGMSPFTPARPRLRAAARIKEAPSWAARCRCGAQACVASKMRKFGDTQASAALGTGTAAVPPHTVSHGHARSLRWRVPWPAHDPGQPHRTDHLSGTTFDVCTG
eukprot:1188904-Prymnesium_polylepis.1